MKYKFNLYELIEWLVIIVIVLNCHSVYNVGNVNLYFEQVSFFLVMLLFFIRTKRVNKYLVYCAGGYLVYQIPIILYAFTISNYALTYVFKYVLLFVILFLLYASDYTFIERLINKFCSVIFVLSVISLVFYIGATILNIIPPTGAFYLKWSPERWINSFFGIYFEVSPGKVFDFKNACIFAESPIYAAIVCVAQTFELFAGNKKYNYIHIVIFYITLLSTFSTTANIYIVLSFFGILYTNYYEIMRQRVFKFIFSGVVFVVGIMALMFSYELLMEKKNAIGISYLVRMDDYMVAFKALKSNVIFGVGFGNMTYSRDLMTSERIMTANLGQSSDFAALLASGGLYFMLIYVLGLIGLMLHGRNKKAGFILFSLLVYIFIVSRVGATILFMVFICAGLCTFARRKLRLSSDSEM